MSYDRNNLKETTEDGINDLVNDVIGGIVSLDYAFTEIKYKPLQKKISKALELRDDEDWVKASTENSVESYSNYLSSYNREKPWYVGRHVADAISILSELSKSIEDIDEEAWKSASTAHTKESYQSYLSTYDKSAPDYIGKHVSDAKSALNTIALKEQDEYDWKDALTQNSEDGYNAYLSKYINVDEDYKGLHVSEALNAIDSLQKDKQDKEQADREISECKSAWDTVRSINTIQAYQDFISKYDSCVYNEVQTLVVQAKNQVLSIHDDEDWKLALKTNTQKGYDRYIAKYEPLKSEYQGKYLDKAKSWIPGKPNPRIKHIMSACIVVALIGVFLYFMLWWKPGRKPLSEEEINTILVQYTDSLKHDLFDGFYLAPISKADIVDLAHSRVCEESNTLEESLESGLYSREDVIKEFMMDNGKFIVKNSDGITINLPEATNGIDSVCVKDSPFFEYIDNNGLRRVVALYNGELYYYLGECGSVDNIRQFILVNNEGKYGILNINKKENKRFENDKIEQIASSQRYYVINDGVKTEYQNGHEYNTIPSTTSVTATSHTASSNQLNRFYDYDKRAYGYKDSQGKIVIRPQYVDASYSFDGNYAIVKGPNGYGIINRSNVKCVPLQYKHLDLFGSTAIARNGNGLYGLISVSGKILVPFTYKSMSKYGNFIEVKASNGKEGLFDTNGKRILNDIYDDVSYLSINNGLIPCKYNGKWGYMTTSGNKAIDFKYNSAGEFKALGLAAVKDSTNNLYGYINKSGSYVIKPNFYSAGAIDENGAQISNVNGLKARIDKNGNILTTYYKEIGSQFICDRIWVVSDSLVGFSDDRKNLVIPCIFDYPAKKQSKPSFDGFTHLAKVSYNGVEWFINPNGAFAFPAKGNPTNQNITLQIQQAREEAERKLKEKEETENKRISMPDRKSKRQRSKV